MAERLVYLNGDIIPQNNAYISPLDRGFLLGDGVYEVIPVYYKKTFLLEPHIERLNQSLKGIHMEAPLSLNDWKKTLDHLIMNNEHEHQWVYLQVTRGVDHVRGHKIPQDIKPTVFAISYPNHVPSKEEMRKGYKTVSVQDIRWKRCDIKTTSRLAYILMYQEALDQGADEALVFNNGFALEGAISNIFIVRQDEIITPPKSNLLLSGITRDFILQLARKNNLKTSERNLTEQDINTADELWITSSTRGVHPVISNNGQPIGNGLAGPFWEKMWDLFWKSVEHSNNK